MAKHNRKQFTYVVPVFCIICDGPNGTLQSERARFKAGLHYVHGICPKCKPELDRLVDKLMAGGTLTVCTICKSVTVLEAVPEHLQGYVTDMPNGIKRLDIHGCPSCSQEAADVRSDAVDHDPVPGE
jgi:hypothetical protein